MNKLKSISLRSMSKKTIMIIAVVGALSLIAGLVVVRARQGMQAALEDLQTVEAEVGSLVATVGATGSVRANQTAVLSWQVPGTVDEVNVQVGDRVREGEKLATLELNSLPQSVILAGADLVSAQNALDDLYEKHELNLAQAKKDLADARDAVRDAKNIWNGYQYPASQQDINAAYAKVVLAEDSLQKAKNFFNRVKGLSKDNLRRAAALVSLNQAQDAYDAALRDYNYMGGGVSEITIAQGEADYYLAEEQLREAEEYYEILLEGPHPNEVIAAEANVAAAEASWRQAWIEAPFNGIVTLAEPLPGDVVSAGTSAFRVDDTSSLLVDVDISEVDVNRIEVGQAVMLTFDAILATEYTGTVIKVSPVGQVQEGIVNFQVTVELDDADELVKPGMTAAVTIVVSEIESVLLVPNRAVRVLEGERVVYVLSGSNLDTVEIELGASSDVYSAVIGGDLEPGDVIVLNPPANFSPPGGGPPGMGGQ